MTKEEAEYHEFKFCCTCKNLQFRYGNFWCAHFEWPVAEMGTCNHHIYDGKPTPIIIEPEFKQECANCKYNDDGLCGYTGDKIKKTGYCSNYLNEEIADEPETIVDSNDSSTDTNEDNVPEEVTCATCAYAYYNNFRAWCKKYDAALNENDLSPCEEWHAED